MAQEELLTAEWLKTTIEAGTSMEAWMDKVPLGKSLPAVRFFVQTSHDVRGIGDQRERIMVNIDWVIAVVNPGGLVAPLVPLANELDTALHNTSGSTASIAVLSCVRLEPFSLLETEDNAVQFRHAGGVYRTLVQVP